MGNGIENRGQRQRRAEGIAEAKQEGRKFDLVLLDARMPEMDGFATAALIKRSPS